MANNGTLDRNFAILHNIKCTNHTVENSLDTITGAWSTLIKYLFFL